MTLMNFETAKANLVTILGDAAAGQYQVVGYQPQGLSGAQVLDNSRIVQVSSQNATLPKDRAGLTGPFDMDTTYIIGLTVSASTKGDLATLDNEASTEGDRATAIAAMILASENADRQWDELARLVIQTLFDGRNVDVGFVAPYPVQGRWIPGWEKDQPKESGQHAVVTGRILFNCMISEIAPGATPTPAGALPMDADLVIDGDTAKAGTQT